MKKGEFRMGRAPFAIRHSSFAIFLAASLGGCHPGNRPGTPHRDAPGTIRAIWVTRWDFKTPAGIATVMENCKRAGFNTVLFQVRGNGTVLYRSRMEPWAEELGGKDPGFDPLAVACTEAHSRGLRLHAWVNVIPGWRGAKPPQDRSQLYWTHPDWFWRDSGNRRQPLGWYNSVNPCYPEVRQYLVAVLREVVEGYPIDGLHLDYIRFPNDWHKSYSPGRVPDYPRDPRTLALFRAQTGHTPESAARLWDSWRADQVTQLVRDIRRMILEVRPTARLSAAVGAVPEDAYRRHFQDSRRWIAEGLLDAVYPMNYAQDTKTFAKRLTDWSVARTHVPIVMGIMFDRRSPERVLDQASRAVRMGSHFAAFAYNSLFERFDARGQPMTDHRSAQRAALRRRITAFLRRQAASRM